MNFYSIGRGIFKRFYAYFVFESRRDFYLKRVDKMIKGLIEIKNFPFWMHVYAHVSIFLQDPIKYIN